MRLHVPLTIALALSLSACSEEQVDQLPPTNGIYFPIGLATTRLPHLLPETTDDTTALLVSSSNFDLRYSAPEGGTLLSIDPETAIGYPGAWTQLGYERMGSYAGPIAVADDATCKDLALPTELSALSGLALVASRYDDRIYELGIDGTSGGLSVVSVWDGRDGYRDPFAVAVACGPAGNRAYVGYLDPPDSTHGSSGGAWVSEIELPSAASPAGRVLREVNLGPGPVRAMTYDKVTDRLWATTQSSGARALLHSVVLSDPRWQGADPKEAVDTFDLFPLVRGAELKAIAVGTAPATGVSRLFITARLYDAEVQTSSFRPSGDVGGVLIVLDVAEGTDGRPVFSVRDIQSLGLGVGDVAIVRRPVAGAADLAVATARDEGLLLVYDDATGTSRWLIDSDSNGAPLLGDRPIAVAVDQPAGTADAQVYVASFGDHVVKRFKVDFDEADLNKEPTLEALKTLRGVAP